MLNKLRIKPVLATAMFAGIVAVATFIGAGVSVADETWTMNLGPVEGSSLDQKPWRLEMWDAVACKAIADPKTWSKPAVVVKVTARHGAAHVRWQVDGIVLRNGVQAHMWFTAEAPGTGDKSSGHKMPTDPNVGYAKKQNITDCDKK